MPTSPIMNFGMGMLVPLKNPEDASTEVIRLKPNTTFLAGTVVGEITASPGVYGPYAQANVDGSQNPTHLLQYGCVTDAQGNVTFGSGPNSEWGQVQQGCPAYRSGYFNCADIVGLDANAVSKLGRLTQGTPASGHFQMYGE